MNATNHKVDSLQELINEIKRSGKSDLGKMCERPDGTRYRYTTTQTTSKEAVRLFKKYRSDDYSDVIRVGIQRVFLERAGKPRMFRAPVERDTVTLRWITIL